MDRRYLHRRETADREIINFLLKNLSRYHHHHHVTPLLCNHDTPLPPMSCSSPRWENLPSGHQHYLLKGINLGYMYWGQKNSSE